MPHREIVEDDRYRRIHLVDVLYYRRGASKVKANVFMIINEHAVLLG